MADGQVANRLRGPLAWSLASSLCDRPLLWAILRLWLPLSRLWAAAIASGGDCDRFMAEVPLKGPRPPLLARRLAATESTRRRFSEIDAHWEAAMFSGDKILVPLSTVERRRNRAALRLALERLRFLDVALTRTVPPMRYAVPSPAEVERIYGTSAAEPWRAYLPAAVPRVESSRRVSGRVGDLYWLRFPSSAPRLPGFVCARVLEPRGIADPPTLVFANGICVESDFSALLPDRARGLVRRGVRVIEIESPWHGRRRAAGSYGGEPFLATAPLGPIDLFTTEAQDLAVLTGWCREGSRGKVALAGVSMGSLATLLAASHCRHWPQTMRPDALLLMTAVDQIGALEHHSALTTGVRLSSALAAAGWTEDQLARWHPFVAASPRPPLPPEAILAVLGQRDDVLPFAAGHALAKTWRLPDENIFIGGAGHFSTQLSVALDRRVIDRLAELLGVPQR